jgi:spoIIIJ-associated protein
MNDLHDSISVPSTPSAKITSFLNSVITSTGLKLEFNVSESEQGAPTPRLTVQFTGPDTSFLTARHGELLHSLEHLGAQLLRLSPEEHHRISFDADNFKLDRELELRSFADLAINSVRSTGRPYAFPPMNSRERRMLHLLLSESGLPTASSGEIPRRYVILYPEGRSPDEVQPRSAGQNQASAEERARAIRKSFRSR